MSKATDLWSTPKPFFELVAKRYGNFSLDCAASYNNRKCERFLSGPHGNHVDCPCGLCAPWDNFPGSLNWLNPPFSNLGVWVKKCWEESEERGARIVSLILPSVGSRWFALYVWLFAADIVFLHPRINFDGTEGTNMRDSMLVVWDKAGREKNGRRVLLWRWEEE